MTLTHPRWLPPVGVTSLAVAACLAMVVYTSATAHAEADNQLELVRQSVLAAYPQLNSPEFWIEVATESRTITSPASGPFAVKILKRQPRSPGPSSFDKVLELNVSVFEGRVSSMWAAGDAINSSWLDIARDYIAAHDGWTDVDAIRYLDQRGAQFSPTIVDHPPEIFVELLRRLQPLIGRVSVTRAAFDGIDPDSVANGRPEVSLLWSVEGHVSLANGRSARYSASFEPFTGELVRLQIDDPYR